MELKGKKINFLGDSITAGSGASEVSKRYTDLIAKKTGAVCRNYGIGGTRIARQYKPTEENPRHDLDFCGRVAEMEPDADIVVVFGGTNDFGHGDAPFGEDTDTTKDTFCGALNVLYSSLREKYPEAAVVVLTPLHRSEELREGYPEQLFPGKQPLGSYVDAIRRAAARYSLPMLDLFENGICPEGPWGPFEYFTDGLHPNDAGYEKLSDAIIGFLKDM